MTEVSQGPAGRPTALADDAEDYMDDGEDCWNCGGDGFVAHCFQEFACVDPDGGCDDCIRDCDICRGKGVLT